ncbi:TPA: hypothetical protein ACFN76_000460 [Neisseria meningitidis]|nr:hypothetical protein [Neisseria meningitidis]
MQTADESSRQVDGRCLVSMLAVVSLAAVTAASVAVLARVTGCPQNHLTEPS